MNSRSFGSSSGAPAIYLDRDGILNQKPPPHHYVRSARDLIVLPGAADAVSILKDSGYRLVVVSNQRGVARGLLTVRDLHEVEMRLQHEFAVKGGRIDRFYYCLHDLMDGCDCRKPAPGLLFRAASELKLDHAKSIMVGDEETDVETGQAAGCLTVRVGLPERLHGTKANFTCSSLNEFAHRLLRDEFVTGAERPDPPS